MAANNYRLQFSYLGDLAKSMPKKPTTSKARKRFEVSSSNQVCLWQSCISILFQCRFTQFVLNIKLFSAVDIFAWYCCSVDSICSSLFIPKTIFDERVPARSGGFKREQTPWLDMCDKIYCGTKNMDRHCHSNTKATNSNISDSKWYIYAVLNGRICRVCSTRSLAK